MHWYVGFRDPVRRPGAEPTLFEWAGGLPALTRMTRLLYEKHVPADDLLAPVFAAMPPGLPQREAAVFAEAFGGPPVGDRAGDPAAGRPALTGEQRARWVALALRAADETMLPADPQFRGALTVLPGVDLAGHRHTPARVGLGSRRTARRGTRQQQCRRHRL